MRTVSSETSTMERTSLIVGAAMMLAWTLWLGIVGFVLLVAIVSALVWQSHTLAVVCSFLLLAPVMMTALWGTLQVMEGLRKKWVLACSIPSPTWWDMRQGHRVLYQAYFV